MNKYSKISLLIFKQKLATILEYRANFIIRIVAGFISLLFLVSVWRWFRPDDFQTRIWLFYILAGIIGSFNGSSFYRQMSADINTGQLSFYLLQPFSYLARITAHLLAEAVVNVIISLLAIFSTGLFVHGLVKITWGNLLLAIPFIFLGRLMGLLISFLAGSLSFFWINPDPFYLVLDVILSFLFGSALPFWWLPKIWQNIFLLLPFRSVIATPTEMALGITQSLWPNLLSAVVWLVVLSLVSLRIWKRILVYYEAVGS